MIPEGLVRGPFLLVMLGVVGCGGPREARVPEPTIAIDAVVDAELIDPATAELAAALEEQRARACACADRACAEDAEALAVQWGMDHRDVVRAATPTEAQQKQLAAAIEAAEACLEPLIHDH